METLNYQQVIDLLITFLTIAIPISILFGIVEKLVNMFLSFVFGRETVKM